MCARCADQNAAFGACCAAMRVYVWLRQVLAEAFLCLLTQKGKCVTLCVGATPRAGRTVVPATRGKWSLEL